MRCYPIELLLRKQLSHLARVIVRICVLGELLPRLAIACETAESLSVSYCSSCVLNALLPR